MLNTKQQAIQCPTPNCTGQIVIDTYSLLQGVSFACSVCGGAVRIAGESKEQLAQTMQKFDDLKDELSKVKADNNMK